MAAGHRGGGPRRVRALLPGAGALPTSLILVREARPDDADAIARVHVRSWQAAYRALLPDELLDALSVAERRDRWHAVLQDRRPGEANHVAAAAGIVVAFSSVGPARDADVSETTGELYGLYADPDHWGTGAGRALIAVARDALRTGGCTDAVLWVLEGNERAMRFYEADGWRPDGSRKRWEPGGPAAFVVRLRTSLE